MSISVTNNLGGSSTAAAEGAYVWAKYTEEQRDLYTLGRTELIEFGVTNSMDMPENEVQLCITSPEDFDCLLLNECSNWEDLFDGIGLESNYFGGSYYLAKGEDGKVHLEDREEEFDCTLEKIEATDSRYVTLTISSSDLANLKSMLFYAGMSRLYDYMRDKDIVLKSKIQENFVEYVVSDEADKYPYGGELDGYKYYNDANLAEGNIKKGINILGILGRYEGIGALAEYIGCTKMAVDYYTPTADAVAYNTKIPHSLGEKPKLALIATHDINDVPSGYITFGVVDTRVYSSTYFSVGYARYGNAGTTGVPYGTQLQTTDTYIGLYVGQKFKAGVEYLLVTFA